MSEMASEFQIRKASPADAADIAKVHVDTWKSAYAGIVPETYLSQLDYSRREKRWVEILNSDSPTDHNLVGSLDDKIIGFVSGGANRTSEIALDGEVYAIYLLKDFQGHGYGRKLFEASSAQLLNDGFTSALVWVLEDNPTCKFYEAVGGTAKHEKWDEIGGKNLKEIGYEWARIGDKND